MIRTRYRQLAADFRDANDRIARLEQTVRDMAAELAHRSGQSPVALGEPPTVQPDVGGPGMCSYEPYRGGGAQ